MVYDSMNKNVCNMRFCILGYVLFNLVHKNEGFRGT
jgi:hypothetical protein